MVPSQRVAENDQRGAEQDIPGIEEGQSTQHQRNGKETNFIDPQFTEEQIHPAAPAPEENIQCNRNRQQIKWHRQHVWMQISKQVGEKWELINDLQARVVQVIILNDA